MFMSTCNRFVTCKALLGEQFAEALRTVGVIVTRRKSLTSQRLLTIRAIEALAMKRLILVGDTALRNHLGALGTLGGEILLVARYTVDLVVLGYEALRAYCRITCEAQEAVLVELLTLVLHLLHAGLEDLRAFVTARGERLIVAFATVKRLVFGAERFVH